MSIETPFEAASEPDSSDLNRQMSGATNGTFDSSDVSDQQWRRLLKKVDERLAKHSFSEFFGDAAAEGAVYRWGLACARGGAIDDLTNWLSQVAGDAKPSKKLTARVDLSQAARDLIESAQSLSFSPSSAATAVIWAAAMPTLAKDIDQSTWWELLSTLQQLRESALQRNEVDTPIHLMLAGELGLTLSWRLADLPSCKKLRVTSVSAVERWCKADEDSIAMSLSGGRDLRLIMASLIRCRRLISVTGKRSSKDRIEPIASELATWVAALTTHTGATALSKATRADVADDLAKGGLLDRVVQFDPATLRPALKAALGKTPAGGRLAWEVSLPESMHLCDDAKLAVMMPEWDVRRGRTHIDYRHDDIRIEVFGGRQQMLSGRWHTMIEVEQAEQHPRGGWELTCEYTDDDVHYIELEQPWTGGITLQRQFLLIRDDRCLLLADSVAPSGPEAEPDSLGNIRYISRLPVPEKVQMTEEEETREIFLEQGRNRAMALPLAACEWKTGPSRSSLAPTPDHHLSLTARGRDRLYVPLWIDFQQRRLKRKRTWRQLTVADERRIVGDHESVGYRVQIGSEQWLVYRSLVGHRCRTVLGQHLLADFFCGRFDTGDGSVEQLITVEDNETSDCETT